MERNGNDNLYTNPDIYSIWFHTRYPKSEPYIVLFTKNEHPVAIIIAAKNKSTVSLRIGYLIIDSSELKNLDIEIGGLVTDGKKESEIAVLEFLNSLLQQKKFDKLELHHLSEKNVFWNELQKSNFIKFKPIFNIGVEWLAKIREPESGERFIYNKGKTRNTFKRADKKLMKYFNDDVELQIITKKEEVKEFIEKADKITKKSYQYELGVGVLNNDFWQSHLNAVTENNYLRGYLLTGNSIPLAYAFGLVYKDIFYLFATSFDPDYGKISPGGFLIRRIIDKLIEEKVNYFHFGYGDAEYKRLYGNQSLQEASFRFYGSSPKAKITKLFDISFTTVNNFANNILTKTGIIKKVKKFWRSKMIKT